MRYLIRKAWNAVLLGTYKRILKTLSTVELDDELEYWSIQNHKTLYIDGWDRSMLEAVHGEYVRRNLLLPA